VNLYQTNVENEKRAKQETLLSKLSKKEQYNLFLSKLPKVLTQIEIQNDDERSTPILRASQAKILKLSSSNDDKLSSFALSER